MKTFDAAAVNALLDYPALLDALEAGHRTGVDEAKRLLLEARAPTGTANHFLIWPAWQHGEALGIKLVTSFPDNAAAGLPTIHADYLLYDGKHGGPMAMIDGTAMTPWKTAADSALGARFLARDDAQNLLMVGAGVMAPHLIRAHITARPSIRHVEIWNRTPERAQSLAVDLAGEGLDATAVEDLEAAARAADVISCATGATAALIHGAWLRPGTHLDLVGGFTPEMREADDEACRRARIYVDSRWFTIGCVGDLMAPMASGAITEDDVIGDLFQLCRGEVAGRESPQDITFYKNAGGAHLDLMTAQHIAARAGRL